MKPYTPFSTIQYPLMGLARESVFLFLSLSILLCSGARCEVQELVGVFVVDLYVEVESETGLS